MKWFICVNNIEYMRYAAVAVLTCPPGLEPIILIDSRDITHCNPSALININIPDYVNEWTKYMKNKNVLVLEHEVSFIDVIRQVFGDSFIARGAFLRCDIPAVCEKLDIKDEYVFYTDADVFFVNNNIDYILKLNPPFLAATVENDPYNWHLFNSGVMVLNVKAMKGILQDIINNIPIYGHICFDQSVLQATLGNRWSGMLIECNWKTYWELRPSWSAYDIVLVHMHGAKPFSESNACPGLRGGAFSYWMDHFFGLLSKVGL
jgi:hypothetical protein